MLLFVAAIATVQSTINSKGKKQVSVVLDDNLSDSYDHNISGVTPISERRSGTHYIELLNSVRPSYNIFAENQKKKTEQNFENCASDNKRNF